MQVFIYRSRRRGDTYVYLAARDEFERIPPELREQVEPLEFSFEFSLDDGRRLAVEEAAVVRQNLRDAGFHLQSPRELKLMGTAIVGSAGNG